MIEFGTIMWRWRVEIDTCHDHVEQDILYASRLLQSFLHTLEGESRLISACIALARFLVLSTCFMTGSDRRHFLYIGSGYRVGPQAGEQTSNRTTHTLTGGFGRRHIRVQGEGNLRSHEGGGKVMMLPNSEEQANALLRTVRPFFLPARRLLRARHSFSLSIV